LHSATAFDSLQNCSRASLLNCALIRKEASRPFSDSMQMAYTWHTRKLKKLELRSRLTPGGRFTEEPLVYPAEPWHGVVVHGVPLADGEPPDINDLFDEMGAQNRFAHASGRVAGIPRWMWPHDKPLPSECQGLSIRLSFYKEADASRFIRQGMFLFGTLCRVSKYRPRRSPGER
ncbi:hypothetical protein C8R45DRAFT_492022, partial [Mycena sanguinolenta]